MKDQVGVWRQITGRPPGPEGRLLPAEHAAAARALRKLAAGFSGDRSIAGRDYQGDPELLGAYLLFYWPVSYAQARAVLRLSGLKPGERALDLGAGTGPVAMALADTGWRVTAAERSPAARAVMARFGALGVFDWEAGQPLPEGTFDLITMSHVLNELWKSAPDRISKRLTLIEALTERLSPAGHILLIEPARHVINADLLALRDRVAEIGLHIAGPCFYQGPCPARAEGAACHAELHWQPSPLVRDLANAASIDKSVLAFSWLLLSRQPVAVDPARVRVVSEMRLNKAGRERLLVCGVDGRFSLSAPKRGPNQPWRKVWEGLVRGDAVRVEAPEARESGWGVGEGTGLG